MKTYTNLSNEQLVSLIASGEEEAYEQLFRNIAPITIHEAAMYRNTMDYYDMDDFIQLGRIVCWEIITRGHYNPAEGRFSTYFGAAVRRRLIRTFRDYNLKNLVCIEESVDIRGNVTRTMVISEYAIQYRKKKAEQQKRWQERHRVERPKKERKPPLTKEEKAERVKAYYTAHPEKLAEKREKNRIRERQRRAARKAALLAAATV